MPIGRLAFPGTSARPYPEAATSANLKAHSQEWLCHLVGGGALGGDLLLEGVVEGGAGVRVRAANLARG